MSASLPPDQHLLVAELVARVREGERLEIVEGAIVEQAIAGFSHSRAMAAASAALAAFDRRIGGPRGPGGWWLGCDLGVGYPNGDVYAHDVCGFRREGRAQAPEGFPVTDRPDWVCEILSHRKRDLVVKPRTLHHAGVPHFWLLDHQEQVLLVHRWAADGYTVVLRATAGERVKAEPFDSIELEVAELFGGD